MKNKKKLLLVLGIIIGVVIIVFAGISIKDSNERARIKEQELLEEMVIVEKYVCPLAEEFGVTDLKLDHFDGDRLFAHCYFTSEQYAEIDDPDKLLLLVSIEENCQEGVVPFPSSSPREGQGIYPHIMCGDHEFVQSIHDGVSNLYEKYDNKDHLICSLSTGYASDTTKSVDAMLGRSEKKNKGDKGSKECPVCGGTGLVKYYYGSSCWEAWFSGHNNYELGECTSCGGTGYY